MNLIINFLFCISCLHIFVTSIRFILALKTLNELQLTLVDKIGMYIAVAYFFAFIFS